MINKYLKRGGTFLGISLFLLSLFLANFPVGVSAAPSVNGQWVNFSVIKATVRFSGNADLTDQARDLGASEVNRLLGEIEFKDTDIEDTKRQWLGPQKANCGDTGRSKIEASQGETASGKNLTITDLYVSSDRFGCVKVNRSTIKISPSSIGNRNILFNWVNESTIKRVDGKGGDYKKSSQSTRAGRDVFSSNDAPGSEGCKVRVELKQNPKGPTTEGRYYICNANGSNGGASNWGDTERDVLIGNFAAYTDNPEAGAGTDAPPTCESQNDGIIIGWLLCQVLSAVDDTVTKLLKTVDELLYVSDTAFENEQLQDVWSYFRVLATFLLVAIGLVMVISQAISIGPFDAYTVKKVFPRLVVGVIGIQLSWYLFTALIQVVNAIAWGIEGLMYAPFGGAANFTVESILGGQAGLFISGAGGALAVGGLALGLLGLLSLGLTALIGVFIAFALLSARRFILIGLLVVAPIALVAWILPNTEKFWKIWWESFSKLLMMYPLILFIVASGRIFAYIVSGADTASSENAGLVETAVGDPILLLMLVAGLFGPFYLIPKTFQLAGGAFANIAGVTNNGSRGVFDRLKNYRGQKFNENYQKTKNFSRFSDRNALTRGINTLGGAVVNPRDSVRGAAGVRGARQTGRRMQGEEIFKQDATLMANQNDDAFLIAVADEDLAIQKINAAKATYDSAMASGDIEKANGARAEVDVRTNALNNARNVNSRKSASTRQAALMKLAQTGYQFETGANGYKELTQITDSISGGDAGLSGNLLNEAQFHLKNAGRFDLGGINHGAGYDVKTGIDKVDPYTMASRAKPETIKAKGGMMRESLAKAVAAKASGDMGTYDKEMKQAQIHKLELEAAMDSATGKNKDTILKEVDTVKGINEFNDWANESSGTTQTRRVNYVTGAAGWSADEQARGWRMEDVDVKKIEYAKAEARGARRPNANELED